MKTFDSSISMEQLKQALAELAGRSCAQSGMIDADDASEAGGRIFRAVVMAMIQEKDFPKRVKAIFPGYNEELFLDEATK